MFKIARGICALQNVSSMNLFKRLAHFDSKAVLPDYDNLPSYEVTKDPKEWEFVERLLPRDTVPPPPAVGKRLPSGWKPQTVKPGEFPYHIPRTRNHMLPVYLSLQFRNQRRHTRVRHVEGDIHALAAELMSYLQAKDTKKGIGMRVSEISGEIRFMGDHVSNIKAWLEKRNF